MNISEFTTAISSVGFPIFACCYMFYLNNKLTEKISELNATLEAIKDRIN